MTAGRLPHIARQRRRGDRRPRPDQIVRRPGGGARPVDAGQARHDLRLSRPERLRQDHHHPHAVRPAHARPGHGTCLGYDIRTETDKIKRHVGYMTQRFSLYQDLSVAREPGIRRAALCGCEIRCGAARDMIERLGLQRPRGAARGLAVRRLEAAARARRLHACRTRSFCCSTSRPRASIPRRGANSGTRSTRSRPKASPCWSRPTTWTRPSAATRSHISPMASLLTHGTVDEVIAQSGLRHLYGVSGEDLRHLSAELTSKPGVDMVAPFGTSLHVSGPRSRQSSRPRSRPIAATRSYTGRSPSPRSKTCSST